MGKMTDSKLADAVVGWFTNARYSKTEPELDKVFFCCFLFCFAPPSFQKWSKFTKENTLPTPVLTYMENVLKQWKESSAVWVVERTRGCEDENGSVCFIGIRNKQLFSNSQASHRTLPNPSIELLKILRTSK